MANALDPSLVPGDMPVGDVGVPVVPYGAWPTRDDVAQRLRAAGVVLRGDPDTVGADAQLRIDAAVAECAHVTARQFLADTEDQTRFYDGSGTPELEVDEMVSLTSVALLLVPGSDQQVAAGLGVRLLAEYGRPQTRLVRPPIVAGSVFRCGASWQPAFPAGRANIAVTGRFGYGPVIPVDLWQGVCLEAAACQLEEAVFQVDGAVVAWQEGDTREQHTPPDAARLLQWHAAFQRALRRYRKPPGRRLRAWRTRMV